MTKSATPFIYGGPVSPEKFIGRASEIDRVFDQLSSEARGSVAIIGERRIGKTSLMHYVSAPDVIKRWNLDEEESLFIFQDCGAIAPFTITRFWQTILRRLNRTLRRNPPDRSLLQSIQKLLDSPEITALDMEFLLDDLHQAGMLLVLILDEFEWLIRTDPENEATTRDFLAGLRALINHVPRALSLIVSTRQSLDKVCRDVRFMGSPFYNNFVFVHLRPFHPAEAELLFEHMLADTGISFNQAEKDYIFDLAGTHPLLLQTAAALVFEVKVAGAREINDFAPIRLRFLDLIKHQFEDYWKWSQPRERQVLLQLAAGEVEAAARLQMWTDERERLAQRGLIIQKEDGAFCLFSSVFWQWLIANQYRLKEIHPPESPELGHLRQQLVAHQRRLAVLENQLAKRGELDAPPSIIIDIEDTKTKMAELQTLIARTQA